MRSTLSFCSQRAGLKEYFLLKGLLTGPKTQSTARKHTGNLRQHGLDLSMLQAKTQACHPCCSTGMSAFQRRLADGSGWTGQKKYLTWPLATCPEEAVLYLELKPISAVC